MCGSELSARPQERLCHGQSGRRGQRALATGRTRPASPRRPARRLPHPRRLTGRPAVHCHLETGCSAAWQRATFGTWRPRVQIPASRPAQSPVTWGSVYVGPGLAPDAHRLLTDRTIAGLPSDGWSGRGPRELLVRPMGDRRRGQRGRAMYSPAGPSCVDRERVVRRSTGRPRAIMPSIPVTPATDDNNA
jgi:hypothetical protein